MSGYRLATTMVVVAFLAGACGDGEGGSGTTGGPTVRTASTPIPTPPTATRTPPTATRTPPAATPGQPSSASPLTGPVVPADVQEIATGLEAPWSIAFLPDDAALVSQRGAGTVVRVDSSGEVTEVGAVPGVDGDGEGGLLGLAFDPSSPSTLYVYATMGSNNVVLRTTYADGTFGEFETVFDGIPAGIRHNGGRLLFGPDGMLYVSTGETGDGDNAQDVDNLGGKILRLTPDGDVPADNPFDGSAVYSYGHRNVEGLVFDADGNLWASEFGDRDADELNRIEPGGNYGWPEVEGIAGDERFVDPVVEWSPTSEASPSGLAYVRDTFFLAALRGERLWEVPYLAGSADEPAAFLDDYGRLRDVAVAPDGSLWVLTNNTDGRGNPRPGDDRVLRVTLSPS